MKSAIEVIAKVQIVRALAVMAVLLAVALYLVIAYLLRGEKKTRSGLPCRTSSSRLAHGSEQSSRSIWAITLSSIPRAKKSRTRLRVDARRPLDELDEPPVALAHDGADLGVVAGGVGLHLSLQSRAVGQQLHVRRRPSPSARPRPSCRATPCSNVSSVSLEAAPDGRDEELALGAEEAEEVGLRDAGPAGDRVGRRAVQAGLGELGARGVEDLLAADLCRLACRRHHRGEEVSTHSQLRQAYARTASATRSRSASERNVWNGSASARVKAASAPGNGPWSAYALSRWSA